MIADDVKHLFAKELRNNETLLWADKPRRIPREPVWLGALFIVPFVIFMIAPLAYAIFSGDRSIFDNYSFSINGERVDPETPTSTLWLAFIGISITVAIMVAFLAGYAYVQLREVYAITNQRAIIYSRFPTSRVVTVNPSFVSQIERSGNDQIGTLKFFDSRPGIVQRFMELYRVRLNAFSNISKPRDVEQILVEQFHPSHEKGKTP